MDLLRRVEARRDEVEKTVSFYVKLLRKRCVGSDLCDAADKGETYAQLASHYWNRSSREACDNLKKATAIVNASGTFGQIPRLVYSDTEPWSKEKIEYFLSKYDYFPGLGCGVCSVGAHWDSESMRDALYAPDNK